MYRFKMSRQRPFGLSSRFTFGLGLSLCLAGTLPACRSGSKEEDDEEEEEEESEDEKSSTKDKSDSDDGSSSSSTTGDSSTSSTSTETDSSDDTEDIDPGPKLGKCDRGSAPTMTVSDDVRSSVTWTGVVKLSGAVEVRDGAVLTIAKGTTIIAESGASLSLGGRIDKSTITAVGTTDAPIRFCGATDSAGSWRGIELGDETQAASVLSHVSIENAGESDGAALTMQAPIKLEQVEISGSAGHGVIASDFGADSKVLRVTKAQVAARVSKAAGLQNFPKDSVFKENLNNVIEFDFDSLEGSLVLRNFGVAYRQLRDLRLRDSAKLTLQAGVKYEVAPRREIEVGDFRGKAQLSCEGTQKEPVEILGQEAKPGSWRGITVESDSSTATSFVHTVIRHAGNSERPSLTLRRSIKIDHLSVEDALNGILVKREGFAAGSTHLSVKNTKGYALRVRPEALVGLPTGGSFENNERSVVWVERGELEASGTIVKMPVPYHIEDSIRLGRKVDLVVAPGTEFKMGERADFILDPRDDASSVIMKGTDKETIKFFGEKPSSGYWGSVRAGRDLKKTSVFEHVEFSHGGSGYEDGMLKLDRAFPVKKCVFTKSGGYGISRERNDKTDYTKDNQFKENEDGPVGS